MTLFEAGPKDLKVFLEVLGSERSLLANATIRDQDKKGNTCKTNNDCHRSFFAERNGKRDL
jgi:hypothetical protein